MFRLFVNSKDIDSLVMQYPPAVREAQRTKLTEALLALERFVREEAPVGAGPIHIRDTIVPSGPYFSGTQATGILGTPAEYGPDLEYGSKPHMPDIGALTFWVERVLNLSGKEAIGRAYAIAHKIAKHGTQPKLFFSKGYKKAEPLVNRILAVIPDEIIRRLTS